MAHVHDTHFLHGVGGPVGDAKVGGVDDVVGATRFIDHLFDTAPSGAGRQCVANIDQFTALIVISGEKRERRLVAPRVDVARNYGLSVAG